MKFNNTDAALDTLVRRFKAENGVMTRKQLNMAVAGFSKKVRMAAIAQLELVADVRWVKAHGGRPLPGDVFYWPKRQPARDAAEERDLAEATAADRKIKEDKEEF